MAAESLVSSLCPPPAVAVDAAVAEPATAPAAATADTAQLTARLVRGDEAAWREFHARYEFRLRRYLLVVTAGREELAQEVVQLAFLRAVRHIRVFAEEATLWSWLTVLARTALVDEQRKLQRHENLLDRFFRRRPPVAAMGDDDSEARLLALLETGVGELPADERALVEQKYFAGAPVREIAGELQTTEKAVESRLVRVRRKLKAAIVGRLQQADAADVFQQPRAGDAREHTGGSES